VTVNAISPVAATRMTLTDEFLKAREIRRQQGIIREERALAQLEDLKPEDVAPMVVFLASDHAVNVNGQFFLCAGGSISLVSQPRAIKTIFKADAAWTLDELDEVVPLTLAEGLVNPAPPKTTGA
ncbi:MAG: SDR family oxidoreductase, partial [Deltaproteobacteria bacterium]|nr:SDR family oxidoreductase [Deltaproteobacteria bacterium]